CARGDWGDMEGLDSW
nr:immunoglobulin heavy chain junction region [Macaca mulatta]MOW76267.1 immunoglobulin heavy chain junction region [Macaca mulatta]MOW76538.1 immunoglobulin heavy chain junction region [Macaca mulatta]MOW76601.1 immunoglobulin heavy chain junction region [Macaca mulatta]MOW76846.1 immunoglobulin heavy chain junction region [Macaca mulatta]